MPLLLLLLRLHVASPPHLLLLLLRLLLLLLLLLLLRLRGRWRGYRHLRQTRLRGPFSPFPQPLQDCCFISGLCFTEYSWVQLQPVHPISKP